LADFFAAASSIAPSGAFVRNKFDGSAAADSAVGCAGGGVVGASSLSQPTITPTQATASVRQQIVFFITVITHLLSKV
jgi:hypothetical protein